MTNPLEEQFEAFKKAMAAFKVVRRVLDKYKDPLSNTPFRKLDPAVGHELLDDAEEQLNRLVAFALFAAFERTLRDSLVTNLAAIQSSSTTPHELAGKLHRFLEGGVDTWRIDRVMELFSPPASAQDINNAKNIRTHRHHVAHGAVPPVPMLPQTVYSHLSSFLRNAGLVE